jgi:hypothetical protein
MLLLRALSPVLAELALVGVGTFFAQATVPGFISRAAMGDRGAASGIYLACYLTSSVGSLAARCWARSSTVSPGRLACWGSALRWRSLR